MWDELWQRLRWEIGVERNPIYIVIVGQVACFILLGLVRLGGAMLSPSEGLMFSVIERLALPASLTAWIRNPWTIVTYSFVHAGVFHLLFNTLIFYWFARIFSDLVGQYRVWWIVGGGMVGGALAYWGGMAWLDDGGHLIGGSAVSMAMMVAAATLAPRYPMYLLLFGSVRIAYLAVVILLLDILLIPGGNVGGHIAHLGGALWGFLYVRWMQGRLGELPVRRPGKVKSPENTSAAVDRILEKVVREGMDSLTDRERQILEDASRRFRNR